jgi:hypothetical protein
LGAIISFGLAAPWPETFLALFVSRALNRPALSPARVLVLAAFNTIQSLGFSFTNSLRRRTAVVGLIFKIEAVLASIDGGTTKRP